MSASGIKFLIGSGRTAESSAMIFSIIQTAIANGLKTRDYLEKLITEISDNPREEELEKLLPWNIKP